MKRLGFLLVIALIGCTTQRGERHAAPVRGAVLTADVGSDAAAIRLLDEIQAAVQAHPQWAGQILSHGAAPPTGYFIKFAGRCAARPPAAVALAAILVKSASLEPRCEDLGS